jgi:hypothetical protein
MTSPDSVALGQGAPARATLQQLADWLGFTPPWRGLPSETSFWLTTIPLISVAHHEGLTLTGVFADDPPGYYLRLRDAYRARTLPPVVVTEAEILDGYRRIALALADRARTIAAYVPEHGNRPDTWSRPRS